MIEVTLGKNIYQLEDVMLAATRHWQNSVFRGGKDGAVGGNEADGRSGLGVGGKVAGRGFIVVPDNCAFEVEQHYLQLAGKGSLLLAEALGWQHFFLRLADELNVPSANLLDKSGQAALLNRILHAHRDELPFLGKLVNKRGFLHQIQDILLEFRRYNVGAADLCALGKKLAEHPVEGLSEPEKILDWSRLLGLFESEIAENNLPDQKGRLRLLAEWLESAVKSKKARAMAGDTAAELRDEVVLNYICQTNFWFWGIGDDYLLTGDEKRIILALSGLQANLYFYFAAESLTETTRRNLNIAGVVIENEAEMNGFRSSADYCFSSAAIDFVVAELPVRKVRFLPGSVALRSGSPLDVVTVTVPDMTVEAETTIAELLRLHLTENIPWQEMAIICSDESLHEALNLAGQQLGVPLQDAGKLKLSDSPVFTYLNALFDLPRRNWSLPAVLNLLRSGLTGATTDEIDVAENYWLANGLGYTAIFDAKRYNSAATDSDVDADADVDVDVKTDAAMHAAAALDPGNVLTLNAEPESVADDAAVAWQLVVKHLRPVYEFITALPLELPCREMLDRLNLFFQAVDLTGTLRQRMADAPAGQEILYSKGWQEFFKAARTLRDLQGDVVEQFADLGEILADLLTDLTVNIVPSRLSQVKIGSATEILSANLKVIYVLRADEELSGCSAYSGLLRDSERAALGKLLQINWPGQHQSDYWRNASVWRRLADAASKIYFSRNDGEFESVLQQLASRRQINLLHQVTLADKLSPNDLRYWYPKFRRQDYQPTATGEVITSLNVSADGASENGGADKGWRENGASEKIHSVSRQVVLSDEMKMSALPLTQKLSVSRLEKYAACPYQYLVDYLLMARPREEWNPQVTDVGVLMHGILEKYLPMKLAENETYSMTLARLEQEDLAGRMAEVGEWLDEYIAADSRLRAFRDAGIYSSVTRQVKRRLSRSLPAIWASFLSGAAGEHKIFRPTAYEWAFGLSEAGGSARPPYRLRLSTGDSVDLCGKIDRIDFAMNSDLQPTGEFRIVDYKSNRSEPNIYHIYYGLEFQLPLYIAAYAAHLRRPTGEDFQDDAGYFSLKPKTDVPQTFSGLKKGLNKLQKEGFPVEAVSDLVKKAEFKAGELVEALRGGSFNPHPRVADYKDELPCRYCRARGICGNDRGLLNANVCRVRVKKVAPSSASSSAPSSGGEVNDG